MCARDDGAAPGYDSGGHAEALLGGFAGGVDLLMRHVDELV